MLVCGQPVSPLHYSTHHQLLFFYFNVSLVYLSSHYFNILLWSNIYSFILFIWLRFSWSPHPVSKPLFLKIIFVVLLFLWFWYALCSHSFKPVTTIAFTYLFLSSQVFIVPLYKGIYIYIWNKRIFQNIHGKEEPQMSFMKNVEINIYEESSKIWEYVQQRVCKDFKPCLDFFCTAIVTFQFHFSIKLMETSG